MAKKDISKTKAPELKPRVSFPITILPRDNQKKTLPGWRQARDAAESIYWPQRKTLHDMYREITLDPHLTNEMDTRLRGVTNVTWTFQLDGDPIPELESFIKKRAFKKLIRHIIEARLYGFSLIEIIDIRQAIIELVPREHVLPEQNLVVADPYLASEGYDYTKPPFAGRVLAVGEPDDLGLLFKVAPYVILKKGDVSDWATYCEIFGSPLRVGKYDPTMPENQKQVENSLRQMGANAWGAFPIGTEFEYIDANKGGTGNTVYQSFAEFCNAEISKALVGQTMTSSDGSSEAQAKIHKEKLEEINRDDREYVQAILNEDFIPILVAAGFDIPAGAEFTAMEEESTLTKKDRLEMDLRIHKEVRPLKEDYFAEEYNVEFDPNVTLSLSKGEGQPPVTPSITPNVTPSVVEGPKGEKPKKASLWDFFH